MKGGTEVGGGGGVYLYAVILIVFGISGSSVSLSYLHVLQICKIKSIISKIEPMRAI